MTAWLDDRAVLSLSGPDARDFLQGLITNDIRRLSGASPLYAALLTPQGKILFDFLIFELDGAILLDCTSDAAEALRKRLLLYRLRAKVDIACRPDLAIVASWNERGLDRPEAKDPRVASLGFRALVDRNAIPAGCALSHAYLAHRLDLGVPQDGDFGHDRVFALDADLDELHGVSFEKGCYVGQELTARMKHRGTARKRLMPVESLDGSALPGAGCSIASGTLDLGPILSAYGPRGFALLRLDRLAQADEGGLAANGLGVRVVRPEWLFS